MTENSNSETHIGKQVSECVQSTASVIDPTGSSGSSARPAPNPPPMQFFAKSFEAPKLTK